MYKSPFDHFKHICYGYNLETTVTAKSDFNIIGADLDAVKAGTECLSSHQCDQLLNHDVTHAYIGMENIYGEGGKKVGCTCATYVLVEMVYDLGQPVILTYNNFNNLMEQQNWQGAVNDLKKTKWCDQNASRCTRDSNQILMC